jgi:hypothetical protein
MQPSYCQWGFLDAKIAVQRLALQDQKTVQWLIVWKQNSHEYTSQGTRIGHGLIFEAEKRATAVNIDH